MYRGSDRLIIIDADGTLIDAFTAIGAAFARHGMDLGDLERFQKRRNLFKYLGGIKEFPRNLAKHFGRNGRKELIATLTDIYRDEARLYPGMDACCGCSRATAWRSAGWTSSTTSPCATKRSPTSAPRANAWASTPPAPTPAATSTRTSPPPSPPACTPSWSATASKTTPA